jgi:hypothetical protein
LPIHPPLGDFEHVYISSDLTAGVIKCLGVFGACARLAQISSHSQALPTQVLYKQGDIIWMLVPLEPGYDKTFWLVVYAPSRLFSASCMRPKARLTRPVDFYVRAEPGCQTNLPHMWRGSIPYRDIQTSTSCMHRNRPRKSEEVRVHDVYFVNDDACASN